jgi:hypothetical protein
MVLPFTVSLFALSFVQTKLENKEIKSNPTLPEGKTVNVTAVLR